MRGRWLLSAILTAATQQILAQPVEAVTVADIETVLAAPTPATPAKKLYTRGYTEPSLYGRGPQGITADEPNLPIAMAPIQFDHNKGTISSASFAILDAYGQALTNPRLQRAIIAIAGHTDSDGGEDANLLLSYQRAQAVRNYLTNRFGIHPRRLRIEVYGESQPLTGNDTAEGKARNRRVEFIRLGWIE